jgi:hypothetical protein
MEPIEIIHPSQAQKNNPDTANLNSGFILAYDISYALEIKENPNGAVLQQTK